ncbi:transglycosylase domain-containing protein [Effusibacillus lacus]|uniref:Penicillin-binding protein n=1 Tax=Effusibacillus lacus TaxID=1348429 RepID=A0A292YKX9_9BACL|nr:PBP1A family penicillin-binding protein [Effusibacillus lacus]TCS73198.1 penicillin-binding protein 2A [Effusibacillus lacus]GAX90598.1 penicillin-binding protein [Effusibacillus lacus]
MGKKIIRSIILAMIVSGTIVLGVGCAVVLPPLDPSKLEVPDSATQIYSVGNTKQPAIVIKLDKGEGVPYKDLKPYVKQAIIATEDRHFYDHNGISYRGIARALYRDILAGGKVEGGSTITQQLAKNALLNAVNDRTITRKIKEIALAAQIERQYTKDDILEMYMNKVNFHPSVIGIEAASKIYFGKSAKDLELHEAAFLAGLPQAPSYYYNNLEKAKERQKIVLQNMVKEEYISQAQADEAVNKPLDIKKADLTSFKYPHYVEYVLEEAESKHGIPREQLLRGGLQIYTYLDVKAQAAAESQFNDPKNFPADAADKTKVQGAMVIVDPKTGGIKALVGGRDTNSFMNLNRAFQIKRQPGSSIKPLMSYGPAIDLDSRKFGPNTMINDKKGSTYGDPPYAFTPNDWDGHTLYPREKVTMLEALRQSWNIPAVDVLNQIGVSTGKKFAEKAGLTFDKGDNNLALALGAMTTGVSPLQMADAYQAFSNKGVRIEAHAIQKIVTASGTILAQEKPARVQVMKESTANTMTSLLKVVVDRGTGTGAQMNRPVAGKTGTTEYKKEIPGSNRDTWFVGYTPEWVAAVWMGFDNTDDKHYLQDRPGAYVSAYPAKMFSKVMTPALQGVPVTGFPVGAAVEEKKEEKQTIQLTGEWTGKTVMLRWTPLKEEAVYAVFRVENVEKPEGGLPLILTKETTFVDTDAEPGKTYYYAISAVDPANNSKQLGESNKLQVKTGDDKQKPGDREKPGDKNKPQDPSKPPEPGTGGSGTGGGQGAGGGTGGTPGTTPNTPGGSQNGGSGTSGGAGGTGNGGSAGGTSAGTGDQGGTVPGGIPVPVPSQ